MTKAEMLRMIQDKRPDLLAGKDPAALADAEIETLARMAQELSLDRIRDLIYEALRARFPGGDNGPYTYVREVYPSYLVYELDAKYYRLSWSILDGAVQLGADPAEVDKQWVDIRSAQAESDEGVEMTMRLGAAKDPEGSAWDVTICQAGHTLNGWYIPDEALRAAADGSLFENVDVNLYELPQGASHVPDPLFDLKSLLVKNKVGWIDGVKHAAGVGLQGVLHFLDTAKWLGKNLMTAMKDGKAVYGLSYDCPVRAKKDVIDGKPVFRVLKFVAADSVDIVTRPAAGGKFNRAVASMPAHNQEDQMKKKLFEIIKEKRPDLLVGKDLDKLSDAEVETLARMAMEPTASGGAPDALTVTKDDLALLRCEMALKDRLAGSDLPDLAKDRIRGIFAGKVFETADLDRAVADEKDYLAKMATSAAGSPEGVPSSGIAVGIGTLERASMAADRLFGITAAQLTELAGIQRLDHQPFFADVRSTQDIASYEQVPAFRSLREMYEFFTGDPEVSGRFDRRRIPADLRSRMDITSTTFSFVLGNTLARRLVSVYREIKYREELVISIKKPVRDFRTQEAVLVGGFPDLADVDPEAADFVEIAGVTDEESTYSLGQKGNILTITRKTIINDDISIINRLVNALGRAARRTHAKYVWNLLIGNANCTDGTAMFTGAGLHGNLGATALGHATALVAWQALAKFTEKDSGERLGLLDDPDIKPNLIGPVDLATTIDQIANEDFYYTGANDLTTKTPNFLRGKVNPVTLSLLTDTNDWYLMLPANVAEIIEMGYLNGREEPEMFLADSPQSEQVFVADKIRHKIRHEYAGAAIDYRSGYKAVVA